MKTLAAVLHKVKEPLRIDEIGIPCLQRGQVLVSIAYGGVCRTQLLEVQGKRGDDRFVPHTLGHEASGTVMEVGDGVRKVRPGDRVVLSWLRGRGLEVGSTTYASSSGPINSGAVSTFMHMTVTCENRVTPVPPTMPLQQVALLGCAVPTGTGAVINTARVRAGESIAIFGVGGVGLSAVLAADLVHASPIIAIDIVDQKLQQAVALGATHTIDAKSIDPLTAIMEMTGGRGVDYSIEAAGRRQLMEQAFRSVRERGGVCILAGNLPHQERIEIDPMDLVKGRRIVGSMGGETDPDRDIPVYADLYVRGRLNLDPLITHLHPLTDVNRALDDLLQKRAGLVLLEMNANGY